MSQLRHAQLFARIIDRPLLILPRHAMAMWNGLSARFGEWTGQAPLPFDANAEAVDERLALIEAGEGRAKMSQFVGDPISRSDGRGVEPYRVQNGVAVIPVLGELVNRGAWIGANSGLVSYEGLKFQLDRARNDSRVRSVILDIDSPGGEAVGFELAAQAVQRLAAEKRTVAVANGMSASAAYALASGASRIVTGKTGVVGSIGVIMMHVDMSRAIEAEGVTPTLIYAGEHKADGNPFEPLPENVREDLQKEVFAFYDQFVNLVAQGRGKKTSASDARATEARTYIGKDAVAAKLADEVGSFEDVLDDLSSKTRQRRKPMNQRALAELADNEVAMTVSNIEAEATTTEHKSDGIEFGGETFADLAAVEKKATQGAYGRVLTILNDERVAGRERFAIALACEAPDMDAEKVITLTEQSGTGSARTIADRHADTGASAINSEPVEPKVESPLAKSVAKINERV